MSLHKAKRKIESVQFAATCQGKILKKKLSCKEINDFKLHEQLTGVPHTTFKCDIVNTYS